MAPCRCTETSALRELGLPIPPGHDCAYVVTRNALVTVAMVTANRLAAYAQRNPTDAADVWASVYHTEMGRLVYEAKKTGQL